MATGIIELLRHLSEYVPLNTGRAIITPCVNAGWHPSGRFGVFEARLRSNHVWS